MGGRVEKKGNGPEGPKSKILQEEEADERMKKGAGPWLPRNRVLEKNAKEFRSTTTE